MPNITESKRTQILSKVKQTVEARKAKGPIQDPDQIRRATLFIPTGRQVAQEVRDNADNNPRGLTPAEANDVADEMEVLADAFTQCFQAFLEADVAVTRRGRPNILYGPTLRAKAAKGAEILVVLRSTVADAFDAADETGRAIREGCGVGINMRLESPVEVQRHLHMARAVLTDPAYTQAFDTAGPCLAVLTRQVGEATVELDRALAAGPGDAALVVRARKAESQLEMETIASRVLMLTATAMGKEKRDELRALWPSTSNTRKTDEEVVPAGEGNVTDINGSVVPTGTGTTSPLLHAPSTPPVPALKPLLGTTVPTPMVMAPGDASGGKSGAGEAGGTGVPAPTSNGAGTGPNAGSTNGAGSNGALMLLTAGGSSAAHGVNGVAHG